MTLDQLLYSSFIRSGSSNILCSGPLSSNRAPNGPSTSNPFQFVRPECLARGLFQCHSFSSLSNQVLVPNLDMNFELVDKTLRRSGSGFAAPAPLSNALPVHQMPSLLPYPESVHTRGQAHGTQTSHSQPEEVFRPGEDSCCYPVSEFED